MKIESISPSRFKTAEQCWFKYWLTYHRPDISLRSNFGAANGSLIHDILEKRVTDPNLDWIQRLYLGYQGTLSTTDKFGRDTILDSPLKWAKDKAYIKPKCDGCSYNTNKQCRISSQEIDTIDKCPKSMFEDSIKMTKAAIMKYGPIFQQSKIIDTELLLEIPLPGMEHVRFIGLMDLVIEHPDYPDTIEIIDYKTGTWTQGFEECKQDSQPRMYSWAARKYFIEDIFNKGYRYKKIILTFDYFTAYPVTIAFSLEEDKKTEEYMLAKTREIANKTRITRIIGERGEFNWKCKSLCDTEICTKEWNGAFDV